MSLDNGGQISGGATNTPLKGGKGSYLEGGVRVPAFIHSPLLSSGGQINNDLLHITDWFPTLLQLAGVSTKEKEVDGYNIWDAIRYSLSIFCLLL